MSLDPPQVLLEHSFLAALIHLDDPNHVAAVTCYAELIDQYEDERILLKALDMDLADLDPESRMRHGLLAPVSTMFVAQQHRNAVPGSLVTDPDLALTMIMVVWNKVRRIATFDARFDGFDVEVLPRPAAAPELDEANAVGGDDGGYSNPA